MFAAAMLTALAGGAFLLHAPSTPEAAEPAASQAGSGAPPAAAPAIPSPDAVSPTPRNVPATAEDDDTLPLPPEPPRLADSPEYEACLLQLRADPEGALARATKWEEQGGGEGAKHCLALSLLSLSEAAQAAGRLERLASSSSASGPARAAVFAQASQAWMIAGDANRAYGTSTLALMLQPTDTALLVDRAVAAAALGRYREALQDLDVAVGQDGSRVESWAFRAAALRHLDRTEEAMRDVEHALALNPRHPEALLERGILRQLKGDTAGARADWQRTITLAPDSAAADLAQQNLALNEAGPRRR
jgi:tetratricopeptide (TPR) repeat protein